MDFNLPSLEQLHQFWGRAVREWNAGYTSFDAEKEEDAQEGGSRRHRPAAEQALCAVPLRGRSKRPAQRPSTCQGPDAAIHTLSPIESSPKSFENTTILLLQIKKSGLQDVGNCQGLHGQQVAGRGGYWLLTMAATFPPGPSL